jgi:hypothetical protein
MSSAPGLVAVLDKLKTPTANAQFAVSMWVREVKKITGKRKLDIVPKYDPPSECPFLFVDLNKSRVLCEKEGGTNERRQRYLSRYVMY